MAYISPELYARIQQRIKLIRRTFGYKQSNITGVFHYIEIVVTKHLDKQDALDRNNNANGGLSWKQFRDKYFLEIYRRDKGCCQYCNKHLSKKESTLDHVLSPLRGGYNTLENIKLSCSWCNNDKGILTEEEYRYKQFVNASKGIKPV